MKPQSLSQIFTALVVVLASVTTAGKPSHSQQAPASGQRGFYCDTSMNSPITIYQTAEGNREIWIKWTSNTFADSGYDPLTRCQQVSARLETYRRNKKLKYITVGRMNAQSVVCTASRVNGPCEGLIYTLKPGQNAITTLNNLLAWREGQAGVPSLSESGSIPYIDVSDRLGDDTTSVTPSSSVTSPNVQSTPQQPKKGSGMRDL